MICLHFGINTDQHFHRIGICRLWSSQAAFVALYEVLVGGRMIVDRLVFLSCQLGDFVQDIRVFECVCFDRLNDEGSVRSVNVTFLKKTQENNNISAKISYKLADTKIINNQAHKSNTQT